MRSGVLAALILTLSTLGAWAADLSDENILMIEVAGTANGVIEIELLPEIAPEHVARVKRLARETP